MILRTILRTLASDSVLAACAQGKYPGERTPDLSEPSAQLADISERLLPHCQQLLTQSLPPLAADADSLRLQSETALRTVVASQQVHPPLSSAAPAGVVLHSFWTLCDVLGSVAVVFCLFLEYQPSHSVEGDRYLKYVSPN